MKIELSISTDVTGKAAGSQYTALSEELKPAAMTADELMTHLTVHGHPICCAALKANSQGNCRRQVASFVSAQIVGVDVDHGGRPFDDLRTDPFLQKHASFAYTTPSHTEAHPRYRIIFILPTPITTPDNYKKIVVETADKFGGDKNARDAVRLWFGSPGAKTIWFGKVMEQEDIDDILKDNVEVRNADIQHRAMKQRSMTIDELQNMLKFMPVKMDHMDWKRFVAGIFDEFGQDHRIFDMLEAWSPAERTYANEYKYRLTRGVTIGTTIFLAKQYGYQPPAGLRKETPKTTEEITDAIESFLEARGIYRMNIVRMTIEYSLGDDDWDMVDDYFVNSMLRLMRASGIKTTGQRIWEILNSEFSKPFDPIRDYFDELPDWDGEDHIQALADLLPIDNDLTVSAESQRKNNYIMLRRWIIGAVACGYSHIPNHVMLILQGRQATGKTTFLRNLCPKALKAHHYYEGNISAERDDKINIAKSFICIDDELASFTKRQIESIKSIITKGDDTVRLPYARASIPVKRRTSFAGSVNARTFLNDETGSRRFAVIPIGGRIDLDALEGVDIDKVWTMAKHFFCLGERFWLDAADTEFIEEHNRNFESKNMTDDLVDRWIVSTADDPKARPVSTTWIAQEIRIKLGERQNLVIDNRLIHSLGRSLTKAKHTQKRRMIDGTSYDGWLVRLRDVENYGILTAKPSSQEEAF